MTSTLLLRSATMIDGNVVDIFTEDGIITNVSALPLELAADNTYDLSGYVISPSFTEPHAHLDKAYLADRVKNSTGDLMGAIVGLHEIASSLTHNDIVERSTRAAMLLSRNGITTVRTHADTMVDSGLRNIIALLETKRACADFIDIQVAMLLEWPLSGPLSADRHTLAKEAIEAGVDVVGGCPHLDSNPQAAVEYLLDLAVNNHLPLDLHADENLNPTSSDLEHLADVMIRENVRHQVNASHCVSLATRSEVQMRRIAEKVAQAGITVTALPQTNLFLQARDISSNTPRAITPITILREAGVVVAAGADNMQDLFNPVGRGDPLEIASLLVTASHLTPNIAHELVSTAATYVVSGTRAEISTGMPANLVAVPGINIREVIAMGPPDRFVVYGGVVIHETNT